jgi:2Fe-2S ferredoxin
MPKITYVLENRDETSVEVAVGATVMDGSVRNNLPGIVAECGGSCSCATCHVLVDDEFKEHFDDPTDEELELLEYLDHARPNSRLSCQLLVSGKCDGVRVVVPEGNG